MAQRDTYSELASLFFETRQIIRDNLRGEKPDHNTWLRYETLRYVAEQKEPTMRDIAVHLRIKAPSATSLISRLIRDGWLEKVKRQEDKRLVRVSPSAKGRRVLEGYRKRSANTMRRVFSKLPQKEVDALLRIFRAVRDAHDA